MIRRLAAAGLAVGLAAGAAQADEAAIRAGLAQRVRGLPPIVQVLPAPLPGLWEVRTEASVFYTDAAGRYLVQGTIVDTASGVNLTQESQKALNARFFASLPPADAVVIRQGSGARRMAVFADPNCGFCRQVEHELAALKDVTVLVYLFPLLGDDSVQKARRLWCAPDRAAAWRAWMLSGTEPPAAPRCDTSAIERNTRAAAGRHIQGTPTFLFADGTQVSGAMPAARLEALLGR